VKCLVTGAAGFIGSHLSRRLLGDGHDVTGVDCFTDYYPRWMKERNLEPLFLDRKFSFLGRDVLELDLPELLGGVEAVFHLAAQAGVRSSWGESFSVYIQNNIAATQRLLEAARTRRLGRFIYASSSSVYGLTPTLPMTETSLLYPLSPYGVTKLAAEQLGFLYFKNYRVPTVSLRFFTVYGPGQRPDMAFHKFFKSVAQGRPVTIYGDGRQTRDFTFIADIVEACAAALKLGREGEVYNVGGGHRETLNDLLPLVEDVCGRRVEVTREDIQKGDVADTFADIGKAARELGYSPKTSLRDGLAQEWDWIQKLYPDRSE